MEIDLSKTQLEILQNAGKEQTVLRNVFNVENDKIQRRINEVIQIILEIHGLTSTEGVMLQDGKLIVPDKQEK